jgi:hypothetical protein
MGVVVSLERPDALTDVLDMLKPRGRVFCCTELSAPWAMSLPADGYARFHVIERGGAWLRLEGAKQVTPLASGDLVIVPHGNGHVIADSLKTKPIPIHRLVKGKADSPILLQHGGGGAQTLMTCGSFQIVNSDHNPLLAVLPPLIHIPSGREQLDEWLEPTLKMLAYEARHLGPGSETLVARLIDPCAGRARMGRGATGQSWWLAWSVARSTNRCSTWFDPPRAAKELEHLRAGPRGSDVALDLCGQIHLPGGRTAAYLPDALEVVARFEVACGRESLSRRDGAADRL